MSETGFAKWKWALAALLGLGLWQIIKNAQFITVKTFAALGILEPMAEWIAIPWSLLALAITIFGFHLLYKWPGNGLPTLGFVTDDLKRNVLIGLAAAIAQAALVLLVIIPAFEDQAREVFASVAGLFHSPATMISALVLTIIYGGIVEETFFRAHIVTSVSRAMGSKWWSIALAMVLSAALFGLSHGYQGSFGMIFSALAGLLWAVLYVYTRSIVTAIVAHAGYDVIAFLGIALFYQDMMPS